MKNFIFLIFIFIYLYSSAQERINNLDSIGRRHGFWQIDRELYCKKMKNNDCVQIVFGLEKGNYIHGKKDGFWSIVDTKGKLYKQEYFNKDTLEIIIEYSKNLIKSITRVELINITENNNVTGRYINKDIVIFSKRGYVKKVIFKSSNGNIIIEKY